MKLWEKGYDSDRSVIEFTSGADRKTDISLAEWDIAGSMAHVIMLQKAGLLTDSEKQALLKSLYSLFRKVEKGELKIDPGMEDIHSMIEKELIQMAGETGKKIHTGRSRNDQVLTDIRLYTRHQIDVLAKNVNNLFSLFQSLSRKYKQVLIPGYTHMQPAMVSSFGLWFGSYAESLADDIHLLSSARELNNRCPLGTGAGYGSTLPLNRRLTSDLLEFSGLLFNSAYASLNRGKAEYATASALAAIAQTLSRFSADVCLFMMAELRFIDFPDEYITGSSIMPQKRNPDVFELIRGRTNLIQTIPGQVVNLISGLPSGYNRELQLLKQLIFSGFSETNECIQMIMLMLKNIRIKKSITSDPLYNYIFSTEEAYRLVYQGVPFRDAYKKVAQMLGREMFKPTSADAYTHEGSIGNLCNKEIRKIFHHRMRCFRSPSSAELISKMMKMP